MPLAWVSCAGSRFRGTNREFVQSDECEPRSGTGTAENIEPRDLAGRGARKRSWVGEHAARELCHEATNRSKGKPTMRFKRMMGEAARSLARVASAMERIAAALEEANAAMAADEEELEAAALSESAPDRSVS